MASLETVLQFAGVAAEAAIIGLILFRRVYKTLPLFSSYLVWSFVADLGVVLLLGRFPSARISIYLASAIIDSIFMLCVLMEVSMSVLKPIRGWLPRWIILAVGLFVTLVGAVIWQFIRFPGFNSLPHAFQLIAHLQMTVSAVRVLFFLVLACFSQLLSIGWRDRELQIATGFGFYAIVSLSVALLHVNQGYSPELNSRYHLIDLLGTASYVCALFYWIVSFAQKVPERREFTPRMQNFLLAVAGNARATRMAMTGASKPDSDRPVPR